LRAEEQQENIAEETLSPFVGTPINQWMDR